MTLIRDSRDDGNMAQPTVAAVTALLDRCIVAWGFSPTELRAAPSTIDALVKHEMGEHYFLGPMQELKVLGITILPDLTAPHNLFYATGPEGILR